jgi:branched-chain amino acid transport system ATP-binding protein
MRLAGSPPLLSIDNVSLQFGGVRALTDVSFDVRSGELLSIIGPNGAGKSSLLNCISGVYVPQHGSISLNGIRLTRANPRDLARRGVARTFQNLALFGGMTVAENILTGRNLHLKHGFALQALGFGPARQEERAQRERTEQIMAFLDLTRFRDRDPLQLPYGIQKRVDLGRALAMEPSLLLLDEPMAGMNVDEKIDMCSFLLSIRASFDATIVLIEHDLGVVMNLSDRIVVFDYGRKIGDGTPDEVRRNADVVAAYLGPSAAVH